MAALERRIRRREPGVPEGEIDAARWWAQHLDRAAPEDHVIETDGRTIREVAREMLRLVGWLP